MGVAAALRAYLPNMRFSVVCGASAGALAGVSLLGDVPPGETYSVPQYKYNMYYILRRAGFFGAPSGRVWEAPGLRGAEF